MIHSLLANSWALIAGMGLGALFFGGLWWTVRSALRGGRAGLWFCGSFLLRAGVAVLGFYWLGRQDWACLAFGLVGFILARAIVGAFVRSAAAQHHGVDSRGYRAP